MALTKTQLMEIPGGPGFVGAVSSGSGISISGSGIISALTYVGSAPPTGISAGSLYWDNNLGELFIYYYDGSTSQWVQTNYGKVVGTNLNSTAYEGLIGSNGIEVFSGPNLDGSPISVGLFIGSLPTLP